MTYDSVAEVASQVASGVSYSVVKMSYGRRTELLRRVRELARRVEFLEAGEAAGGKMDAALLRVEIDRIYLKWGVRSVSGLVVDGAEATPETLAEAGPEELFREAVGLVRAQVGLSAAERKN
jgi:hypothetical protein